MGHDTRNTILMPQRKRSPHKLQYLLQQQAEENRNIADQSN